MILETVLGSITAIAVAYLGNETRKTRKGTEEMRDHTVEVKHQVKNSHETNLRDDVDKVIERLDVLIAANTTHTDQLRQLGEDMAVERRERLDLSDRLKNHTH